MRLTPVSQRQGYRARALTCRTGALLLREGKDLVLERELVAVRTSPRGSNLRSPPRGDVIERVGVGRQSLKFGWPKNQEASTYWGTGVRVGVHD